MKTTIIDFLTGHGFNQLAAESLMALSFLTILGIGCFILHTAANKGLIYSLNKLFKKTKTDWDDTLMDFKVFHPLAHIIPLAFLIKFLPEALEDFPLIAPTAVNIAQATMVIIFTQVISRFNKAAHDIMKDFKFFKGKSIKSYFQLVNVIVYIITGIFLVSILAGQDIIAIVTGLGAMTAVLMFVFKDAILGLIASVQLSANDMLRVGDWVTMSAKGVDGDVEEINLTTVKIRSFDKTIVTVPAYDFIENSFKNWRGMQNAGGRRISRAINFRASSIRRLSNSKIEELSSIELLKYYIKDKTEDIKKHNNTFEEGHSVNDRGLTNIGLFRVYATNYLKSHPDIYGDGSMTCMVRQLAPGELGVPIQMYCFTKTTVWAEYEDIQADIFDHLLAVAHKFDLEIFEFGTEINYVGTKTMIQ